MANLWKRNGNTVTINMSYAAGIANVKNPTPDTDVPTLKQASQEYEKKPIKNLSLAERLDEKIEDTKNYLDILVKARETAKDIKFRVGDAAFHPQLGNVLITDIHLGNMFHKNIPKYCEGKIVAECISMRDHTTVPIEELMELNSTTKILYEANKSKS